jgi:hypothetical protein
MYKPIHFLIRNPSTVVSGFQSLFATLTPGAFGYGSLQNRKLSTEIFFIRNKELPICSNCVHFIEREDDYPYHGDRCKKFGEVDFITGEIKYDLAAVCRLSNDKCGKKGLHYTAEDQSWERSEDSK